MQIKIGKITYRHGQHITGTIRGEDFSGRINLKHMDEPHHSRRPSIFICQNIRNGRGIADRFGYLFSYICFYENGRLTDGVVLSQETKKEYNKRNQTPP